VSSAWIDYDQFTVHPVTDDAMGPTLKAADGSSIVHHGYISGTWTDFTAEHQYHGIMVFVVDALFSIPGSAERSNFLFHREAMESAQVDMGWRSKRAFALSVNNTLARYVPAPIFSLALAAPADKKVKTPKPSFERLLWDEMCRREAWDREYESLRFQHPYASDRDVAEFERQKEEEEKARVAWDIEYWAQRKGTQELKPREDNENKSEVPRPRGLRYLLRKVFA